MNVTQLHIDIDQKLQVIASNQTFDLLPQEKDHWLSEAQRRIIKDVISSSISDDTNRLKITNLYSIMELATLGYDLPFVEASTLGIDYEKSIIVPNVHREYLINVYVNMSRTEWPYYNNSIIKCILAKETDMSKFMTNDLNKPSLPHPRYVVREYGIEIFYDEYTTIHSTTVDFIDEVGDIELGYTDETKEEIDINKMRIPVLPDTMRDELVDTTVKLILAAYSIPQSTNRQ